LDVTRSALLVHGLGRTPVSMFPLAGPIRRAGVRPHFFGYSASVESMPRIVARLKRTLTNRRPEFLIGHSLGAILLRLALTELPPTAVKHFLMLGPPNQSPRLARYFVKWGLPFRLFAGSSGRFLSDPDEFLRLHPPPCPTTVFAGTAGPTGRFSPFGSEPNDGIVSVSETRLDDSHEPIQIPALHTWIMSHPTVHRYLRDVMSR
jgi:hypothetical protein